jgi:hypothetical protein
VDAELPSDASTKTATISRAANVIGETTAMSKLWDSAAWRSHGLATVT